MDEAIAIHTPTSKNFKEVVKWAINHNMTWRDGSISINEQYWQTYGSITCIDIKNFKLGYCHKHWALSHGMNVIDMLKFHRNIGVWAIAIANEFGKKFDLR